MNKQLLSRRALQAISKSESHTVHSSLGPPASCRHVQTCVAYRQDAGGPRKLTIDALNILRPSLESQILSCVTILFFMLILFCAGTRGHAGERAAATSSSLAISELRCEYMIDPMGSDNPHPRFFWKLQSGERGQRQSAFQILVDPSRTSLEQGRSDCWDSGKVRGDSSVFVPYAGRKLLSGNQYWWKVKVWDAQGVPSMWSASAHFDTGIFSAKEWHGEWIASDLDLKDYQKELRALPDFGMQPESEIWKEATRIHELTKNVPEAPAVYMRREFKAKRTVRRAMAYVSGLGMYELYINGQKSGDQYLNPAYSDYDKTVYYLAHDVTNQIKAGDNALGVILGNGWYNLITPHALRFYAADYIAPPCLRLRLDIEYEDGTRDRIVSDKSWQFTTDGPIRFNCVLGGETHDARKNMPGWDMPNYDASHWKSVRTAKGPKGKLTALCC